MNMRELMTMWAEIRNTVWSVVRDGGVRYIVMMPVCFVVGIAGGIMLSMGW